jgi:hypothetical protein
MRVCSCLNVSRTNYGISSSLEVRHHLTIGQLIAVAC